MVRPDSRFWFPAFTCVSTAISIPAVKFIGIDAIYVTPVAAIVSALLFLFFDKFTVGLMGNYKFRQIFDKKRSQFEGEWIEYYKSINEVTKQTEMFYGYFRIRYTGRDNDPYLIKGNAYDSQGRNFAWWASKMVKFDGNKGIIDYFYFGHFYDKQYAVRGIGNFRFDDRTSYANLPSKKDYDPTSPHSTTYNSGTGHFVDSSAGGAEQNRFHFLRVTNDLVNSLVGTRNVDDADAERVFVREFHRRYGSDLLNRDYLNLREQGASTFAQTSTVGSPALIVDNVGSNADL